MDKDIFRKKSLDKAKSPENLDDYIQVSNPSVWLLIISVIILLAGACVWGIFGHIDSTVPVIVNVKDGEAACVIAEENITSVRVGLTVKIADREAVVSGIGEKGADGYNCTLSIDEPLADGFYDGKIVLDSHTPISFILN